MKLLKAAICSAIITFGLTTPANALTTPSTSPATDTRTPFASLEPPVPGNENAVTYQAEELANGDVTVTLSENGKFQSDAENINVLNEQGKIVEVLSPQLRDREGREALLAFHQVSDRELIISPIDAYSPFGYWECVGKNAAGGVAGGAAAGCASGVWFAGVGCVAGAGTGAVTGGIATGVGSLIWCS